MRGIVISALILALAFPVVPAFAAKNKKAKQDPAERFDKLDKNKDGQLSKAEFVGKKKDKDKGKGKAKAKKGKGKRKDPGQVKGKKKKGDKKENGKQAKKKQAE